jgi:hypothetical protein
MKYALLIYGKESDWANASPDEMTAIFAEHGRLSDALGDRNLAGEELDLTTTATTVRTTNGQSIVTDGPFAETVEHLGGFYLIEAADLDEALGFARMLSGTVEVRPVVNHCGTP